MNHIRRALTVGLLFVAGAAWGLSSISVYKTFTAEVLTVADLNNSFARLLDEGINPLIALHPGDSTQTTVGVFDTLDAVSTGYNIGVRRSLIFRDRDDSLSVGTGIGDTLRATNILLVGTATPTVGFSDVTTAGKRTLRAYSKHDTLLAPGVNFAETNDLRDSIGVALTDSFGYKSRSFAAGQTLTVNGIADIDTARADCLTVIGPATITGVANIATATNWKLAGTAYTGSMANLNTLTDDSMADALHRHSELSASDGTPNPALSVNAAGDTVEFAITQGADRRIHATPPQGASADDATLGWSMGEAVTSERVALILKQVWDGTYTDYIVDGRTTDGGNNSGNTFRFGKNGALTIDQDFTMNEGDHAIEIHNGSNCSEIDPSETSFTNCSSWSGWKTNIQPVDEDSVLAHFDSLQVRRYTYREAKTREGTGYPVGATAADSARVDSQVSALMAQPHTGFIADWIYPTVKFVNPDADTTSYSLDDVAQATLIAVHDLRRRVATLERQVDSLKALHP